MKYKIVEPWETFWKKIFDYIIENKISVYDAVFYVVLTPNVYHMTNKKLQKFLEMIKNAYDIKMPEYGEIAVFYVLRILDLYAQFKNLPSKNADGLRMLYEIIMSDYRSSDKEYTFEEAYEKDVDMSQMAITSRSWYIIHAIMNNNFVEQVRQLINKSIRDEEITAETAKVSLGVLNGGNKGEFLGSTLKKWAADTTDEIMLERLSAHIEGNNLVFSRELLPYLYALTLYAEHSEQEHVDIVNKYNDLVEKYHLFESQYKGDVKILEDEIEDLKQKLMVAQNNKQIVYMKTDENTETIREELEHKYETVIADLNSEIESWKEVARHAPFTVEEETLKSLKSLTTVLYFGLPNPQLFAYLLKYNVDIRQLSPVEPPASVGNMPIVFNIDVASHKVWEIIKDKKPLIVNGSNRELLAKKIIKWINNV